jgi:hypothetical protein
MINTASRRRAVPEKAPYWNPWLALISAAAGAFVLWASRSGKRWARVVLGLFLTLEGLVWGSLGVFLFVVGNWTNHAVAHHNENLFLINPITFALLFVGPMLVKGSPRAPGALRAISGSLAVIAVAGVLLKVLPRFDQQNWNLICLVLPLSLATAAAFWRPPAR